MKFRSNCQYCKRPLGPDYVQLGRFLFCLECMDMFKRNDWLADPPHVDDILNEIGLKNVPGLRIVSRCPADGMPIYQCWIDTARASATKCPYCMVENKKTEHSE